MFNKINSVFKDWKWLILKPCFVFISFITKEVVIYTNESKNNKSHLFMRNDCKSSQAASMLILIDKYLRHTQLSNDEKISFCKVASEYLEKKKFELDRKSDDLIQ